MKKLILVLAFVILYGCGSGSSGSFATPPAGATPTPPVIEYCAASIIWEAPVMRKNGLPLSPEDFDKFTIYVSNKPGKHEYDLIMVIDVLDKFAITYRIENLPYQESYIYLTVTLTDGRVSHFSPEWSWDCVIGKVYEED